MARRKMKKQQVALKPEMEKKVEVRFQAKRVKAEMRKVLGDQNCIGEEHMKIRLMFEEIERQCLQLKEETEMIMKQKENVLLKFKILKARQLRDFLRKFVAKQNARAYASLAEIKNENP